MTLGLQKCGCYLHADGSADPCGHHAVQEEIRLGYRAPDAECLYCSTPTPSADLTHGMCERCQDERDMIGCHSCGALVPHRITSGSCCPACTKEALRAHTPESTVSAA